MRTPAILIALGAVALLAGCGSDENTDTSAGPADQQIPVRLADYSIDPPAISPREPGKITFSLINNGPSSHALEIEGNGVEAKSNTLGTGDHGDLTVDLKPGTYEMYCPIDGHRARGMEGKIVIRGGSGSGGGTTTNDDDSTSTDSSGYGSG